MARFLKTAALAAILASVGVAYAGEVALPPQEIQWGVLVTQCLKDHPATAEACYVALRGDHLSQWCDGDVDADKSVRNACAAAAERVVAPKRWTPPAGSAPGAGTSGGDYSGPTS